MVGPSLKCNMGVHHRIFCVKYGTGKDGITAINLIFDNIVGPKHEQRTRATTSVISAKGTRKSLNQNEDTCGTCDCDEVGK